MESIAISARIGCWPAGSGGSKAGPESLAEVRHPLPMGVGIMTVDTVRSVLLWSGIINYGILIFWVLVTLGARKMYHRIAGWFGVSAENFDLLNYAGMMFYKLVIFLFFLVPYLAFRIVG
jgi:Family of unknown function (DUF6868)